MIDPLKIAQCSNLIAAACAGFDPYDIAAALASAERVVVSSYRQKALDMGMAEEFDLIMKTSQDYGRAVADRVLRVVRERKTDEQNSERAAEIAAAAIRKASED